MANYYGQTRSNYFAVKDELAFLDEMTKFPVEVISKEAEDGTKLYGFVDADDDGGADIWNAWDEETGEQVELDWDGLFTRHLADDWVAVVISVGSEKYRYLAGDAIAYNNKGETRTVSIEDIYKVAEDLGANRTHASY